VDPLKSPLHQYVDDVIRCATPMEVVERLDLLLRNRGLAFADVNMRLRAFSAGRFPERVGDWEAVKVGETLFWHKSVPMEWQREYEMMRVNRYDLIVMLARMGITPFAWSETADTLNLVGGERWVHDLMQRYGIRDGITASVGARWMINVWSPEKVTMTSKVRVMLATVAMHAALRLEELVRGNLRDTARRPQVSPRELAVLRGASLGQTASETAKVLGLSVETVRTHMKSAQERLGARNSAHAVANAMRLRLLV
jgi:LuxR family quorum sensing-dependent transcriptional regulator